MGKLKCRECGKYFNSEDMVENVCLTCFDLCHDVFFGPDEIFDNDLFIDSESDGIDNFYIGDTIGAIN